MKFHAVNKAMCQSLNLKIENIPYSGSSLSPMLFPHLFFSQQSSLSHTSPTQWTWIWANSRKEIAKARKACCAAVRGLQRAGHDLTSEQQQPHPGAFISRSFTNFASCKTLFLDKNTFWGSRWTWISMDLQTNAVSFPHESRNFWRRLRSWLVFWICVLNEFCLWIQKWWWWWWEWGVLVVARVVVDREKGRMEGNTERTWEF